MNFLRNLVKTVTPSIEICYSALHIEIKMLDFLAEVAINMVRAVHCRFQIGLECVT